MSMKKRITFNGNTIALVVRGKSSPDHKPDLLAQHADVILPNGEVIGFFGTPGGFSSQESGMNMNGVVWNAYEMTTTGRRPHYTNIEYAKLSNTVSTVLLIEINPAQAFKFENYWHKLKRNPGSFHLVGENCSTRASSAFEHASLVDKSIPGLDIPDNLYRQLKAKHTTRSMSGYIGFELKNTQPPLRFHYDLIIEESQR